MRTLDVGFLLLTLHPAQQSVLLLAKPSTRIRSGYELLAGHGLWLSPPVCRSLGHSEPKRVTKEVFLRLQHTESPTRGFLLPVEQIFQIKNKQTASCPLLITFNFPPTHSYNRSLLALASQG